MQLEREQRTSTRVTASRLLGLNLSLRKLLAQTTVKLAAPTADWSATWCHRWVTNGDTALGSRPPRASLVTEDGARSHDSRAPAVGGDSGEVKWRWAAGEARVSGQKQRWRLLTNKQGCKKCFSVRVCVRAYSTLSNQTRLFIYLFIGLLSSMNHRKQPGLYLSVKRSNTSYRGIRL